MRQLNISAAVLALGMPVFFTVSVFIFLAANVHFSSGAPTPDSLRDRCVHTLRRPSSFFQRHFDGSFLKKFFKHWIPFASTMRVRMQFYLYKRDFPDCGREILVDDVESLQMSGFNVEHPTRILIHGWMSQSKGAFNRAIKNAYLSLTVKDQPTSSSSMTTSAPPTAIDIDAITGNSSNININTITITTDSPLSNNQQKSSDTTTDDDNDFNVIVVDWSPLASNANYFSVVQMIEDLGALVADFVRFLHLNTGLHYDDVYLIGHSLGAQISGSAGKQSLPFRFNTIYALDPAGPKFRNRSDEYRIDPSDATYVESIQTSSGLGFGDPVGHATFYPNFGHDQKKCYIYGCSHKRAYDYFAESITSELGFWGTLCRRESEDVWILSNSGVEFRMGGEPSLPKHGTFYVRTAAEPPYALGRREDATTEDSTTEMVL